jgi:transcriptional regulator with XRE-family HTH domain
MSSRINYLSMNMRLLGDRLKRAREAKGLSQEDAAGTRMAAKTLSRLEGGEGNPTLSTLEALATVYGTTVSALIEGLDAASLNAKQFKLAPAQQKHLITEPLENLSFQTLVLVLERFGMVGPEIRASVLAVLYNDGSISEPYLRPGSTTAKRTKAR